MSQASQDAKSFRQPAKSASRRTRALPPRPSLPDAAQAHPETPESADPFRTHTPLQHGLSPLNQKAALRPASAAAPIRRAAAIRADKPSCRQISLEAALPLPAK